MPPYAIARSFQALESILHLCADLPRISAKSNDSHRRALLNKLVRRRAIPHCAPDLPRENRMTDRPASTDLKPWTGPGIREFIAMMAALMAANAISIDSMLPALPAIGDSLHVANSNDRQLVVTAFMLGFGVAQLFYGPLSDRFGRKRILLI